MFSAGTIFQEWQKALQQAATATGTDRDKYQLRIDTRIGAMEKCLPLKIDANFVWTIDQLAERANDTSICNGNFYVNSYYLNLRCEWRCNEGKEMRIFLGAYFVSETTLKWPFERHVTITITNKQCPRAYRAITNPCRIPIPTKVFTYEYSDPFIFIHSDLSNVGLLLSNHLTVSCTVDKE